MKKIINILIANFIFASILFAQPTITNLSPTSGLIGTTVTITGTNFSSTIANNIVWFGGVKAIVTSSTATSLTTTVPFGATHSPIRVLVNGLIAESPKAFNITFTGGDISTTSMAPKVDFTTGNNPYDVSIGDIDGDGKLDMAVANYGSNTVSVYRNISTSGSITTGSFATKVDFATGTYPRGIALGDIDGDGKLDMAVSNEGSNTISVLRNVGYFYNGPKYYVSKTGNDLTGIGSSTLPFATIQRGIEASKSGDTVLVASGSYVERVIVNKEIKLISLLGADSTRIDANNFGTAVTINSNIEATLDGFTLQNGFTSGPGNKSGGLIILNNKSTVKNCVIKNNKGHQGGGIYSMGGLFLNCIIKNNIAEFEGGGVFLEYPGFGDFPIFENCIVSKNNCNSGAGIYGVCKLVNATIVFNIGNYGLTKWGGTSNESTIKNSIIYGNDGSDINSFTTNITYSLIKNSYPGIGNIALNPQFVDSTNGDYSLSKYSHAIGAGTINGAPVKDILGNPRPNPAGTKPDLGAYENSLGAPLILTTTIHSFYPTIAKINEVVLIKGKGFTGTTSVTFGGKATTFTVTTDSTINCTVANESSGGVTVVSPNGTATMLGFIYYTEPIKGSWTQLDGPTGGSFNKLVNLNNTIYAQSDHQLFRSGDFGNSWNKFKLNGYGIRLSTIKGNRAYVMNEISEHYLSNDGGSNWKKVNQLLWLQDIVFAPNGISMVARNGEKYHTSTDTGNTWSAEKTSPGGYIYNIISNSNMILMLAQNGIYKSVDNGATFALANTGLTTSFVSSSFVVNNKFYVNQDGKLYSYNETSNSWELKNSNFNSNSLSSSLDGSKLYSYFYDGFNVSTDGGVTWAKVLAQTVIPNVYVWEIRNILEVNSGIYITTPMGIYKSVDGGKVWSPSTKGLIASYQFAMAYVNNTLFATVNGAGLLKTTDGGLNWSIVNLSPTQTDYYPQQILIKNGVLHVKGSFLFRSLDNGNTWEDKSNLVTSGGYNISMDTSGNNLYLFKSDSKIFKSTDNGNTYTQLANVVYPAGLDINRFEISGNTFYMLIYNNQLPYRSTDDGKTWQQINNMGAGVTAVYDGLFEDGLIIVQTNKGLYRSMDNGNSWQSVGTSSQWFNKIFRMNQVLIGSTFGAAWISTDLGMNWIDVTGILRLEQGFVSMTNDQTNVYAGVAGSGIWKRPISELVGPVISTRILTQWNFNQGVNYNPAVGIGTLSTIGGISKSIVEAGISFGSLPDGQAINISPFPGQGTMNGQVGIQFNVSTINHDSIGLHIDWYPKSGSPNKIKFEYTADGNNWGQFGNVTMNNTQWYSLEVIDFPVATNNNPNFAIRAVAMLDGAVYTGVNGTYNPVSDWKFDNVTIFGKTVGGTGGFATITSFTPTQGNVGTPVTINGTGFNNVSQVNFAGDLSVSFTSTYAAKIVSVSASGGDVVIYGRDDNKVDVFSLSQKIILNSYTIATGNITSVVLANDGMTFMVGRDNGYVAYYSISTGLIRDVFSIGTGSLKVVALATGGFSPNLKLAVATSNFDVRIFDISTGTFSISIGLPSKPLSIDLSRDGDLLVVGMENNNIQSYNTNFNSLEKTFSSHTAGVSAVALSWDRQFIISGSKDKSVKMWKYSDGTLIKTLTNVNWQEIKNVGILSSNSVFYSTNGKEITFWDYPSGNQKGNYFNHTLDITSATRSFDGRTVITGSDDKNLKFLRTGVDAVFNRKSETEISATVPQYASIGRIWINLQGGPPVISSTDFVVKIVQPAPNLFLPLNNTTNLILPSTFSWSKNLNFDKYELQVLDTITAVTQQLYAITSDTFYTAVAGSFLQNKKFWWKVRGIKGTDTSAYSEVRNFTTKKIYSGPLVKFLSVASKIHSGNININYLLEGDTSHKVNLHFYYSDTKGISWKKLTGLNKTLVNISPIKNPVTDTVIWNSRIDAPQVEGDSIFIGTRVTFGSDTSDGVSSNSFSLDNRAPIFSGVTQAISDSNGGKILIKWNKAVEKFGPVNYLVYLSREDSTGLFAVSPQNITDTTFTAADLINFNRYYFAVRAKDNIGNSDSNKVMKSAIPGRTAKMISTIVTNNFNKDSVKFSYKMDLLALDTANLKVEFSKDSGSTWTVMKNIVGKTTNLAKADSEATLIWLSGKEIPNTETDKMRLRISITGLNGLASANQLSQLFTIDLKAPQFSGVANVISNPNGGAVTISWNKAVEKFGPVTYSVYVNKGDSTSLYSVAPVNTIDTTYTAINLTNFNAYYFAVRVKDNIGNSDSNKVIKKGIPGKLVSMKNVAVLKKLNKDTVQFSYSYSSASGDTVSLSFDYSFNAGATWIKAASIIGKTTKLVGVDSQSTLIWLSRNDANNTESKGMKLRVLATGLTGTSTPAISDSFTIDLKAPLFQGIQVALNNSKNIPGSVILSWTPATDLSQPITYRVFMSESSKVYNYNSPNATSTSDTTLITKLQTATFYYFTMWATDSFGNTDSNKVEKVYLTEFLGDYTFDGFITPQDLAIFVKGWKERDLKVADIGPITGKIPKVTSLRDGKINIEDLSVFLLMWNWAFDNSRSGGLNLAGISKDQQSRKQQYRLNTTNEIVIKRGESKGIPFKLSRMKSVDAISVALQFNPEAVRIDSIVPGIMWGDRKNIILLDRTQNEKGIVDVAIANFGNTQFDSEIEQTSIVVYVTALQQQRNQKVNGFIEAYDLQNNHTLNSTIEFSITDRPKIPLQFDLSQNYPNPFNPSTTIEFQLPEASLVSIVIFDVLGREVAELVNAEKSTGYHSITWNSNVTTGVYYYIMRTKNLSGNNFKSNIKKMLILK